jgi:hypothetical protein
MYFQIRDYTLGIMISWHKMSDIKLNFECILIEQYICIYPKEYFLKQYCVRALYSEASTWINKIK